MTLSLIIACAWLVLANLAGSVPSKDNYWSRAYVLMGLGAPLMIWVFWQNGLWLGLLVLAAALSLQARDADAVMLVAPSDHVIPDVADFHAAVQAALPRVRAGDLVTFGITPTRAETGYGYLELADAYFQIGDYDKAKLKINKAISDSNEDEIQWAIESKLGEVCFLQNEFPQSVNHLRNAAAGCN